LKENNLGLGSMALPLAQAPFMIFTFVGIRGMCKLPVESMKEGGILWFTDLTAVDPFYILPVLSVAGIMAVVYVIFYLNFKNYILIYFVAK
jgi:YidC/Oxa1 family membrane protein insertase